MSKKEELVTQEEIETRIYEIRGQKIILDSDLAVIYKIPTFRLNESVKRNQDRFPNDFMFQLTREEVAILTSQNAISRSGHGGRRTLPYAFTEHGALMAANILKSPRAVQMSVFVVRAFVKMRQILIAQRDLAKKLADIEKKLTARLDIHETAIVEVLQQIMTLFSPPPDEPEPPRRQIGFDVREEKKRYGRSRITGKKGKS